MILKKILILALLFSSSIWAGEFENAVAEYNKGNYVQALNTFYALAKEGDSQAQFNVALIYANGKGVAKDHYQAMVWYEKAAQQRNCDAQYNLAKLIVQKAEKGDTHAQERAKEWYEKAAKAGQKEAMNELALFYVKGRGVKRDERKAFALFKQAAQMGESSAQANVALLYAWGKEVPHNKIKAYENFKKALAQGKNEVSSSLEKLCKESSWACQKSEE